MLASLFLLWLYFRARAALRREQIWWRPAPTWVQLGQKVLAAGSDAVKSLQAPPAQLVLPTPAPGPVILEQTLAQPKVKPAPRSAPVAPAAAPVPQTQPPASVAVQPKPKQTFWDESKGID